MEKNKYIYGASIQGIQGFIFSTIHLKMSLVAVSWLRRYVPLCLNPPMSKGARQSSKQPVTSNVSMTTFRNVRKPFWSFQEQ